jgi:hypothetical protein
MKNLIFFILACLSMTGLSAYQSYNYQTYPGQMSEYEQQSLHNQREALKNQERALSQQRGPMPGSQVPKGGKPGW